MIFLTIFLVLKIDSNNIMDMIYLQDRTIIDNIAIKP